MVEEKTTTKRWQNLLHKKCPNCDSRLEDANLFLKCPIMREDGKSCFFIKKTKAIEFLLDPTHKANICLSDHERGIIKEAIQKIVDMS